MKFYTKTFVLFFSLVLSLTALGQATFTASTGLVCDPDDGPTTTPYSALQIPNAPSNILTNATVTLFYNGDLGSQTIEYLTLNGEGNYFILNTQGTGFVGDCNSWLDSASFTVPSSVVTGWISDGVIEFEVTSPSSVDNICSGNSFCVDVRISFDYTPPAYDAGSRNLRTSNFNDGYTQYPLNQYANMQFMGLVENKGDSTLTNAALNLSITPGTFTSVAQGDTLLYGEDSTLFFPNLYNPTSTGLHEAVAYATVAENDTFPKNDTSFYSFNVSDTVIARDVDSSAGGIGNNTPVAFGHRFGLNTQDTITSVTFYLESPTVGTKIRCLLYTYNPITEKPDIVLDSTRVFQVSSNSPGWYTLKLGCGDGIYPPGDYFIAAEQINPVNMSFGYSGYYPSNVNYVINYVDLKNGQGWLKSTNPALNTLLNSITFMLRVNLGHYEEPNVLSSDTTKFCFNSEVWLGKDISYESYVWSNGSITDSIRVTNSGQFAVTVTDDLGCAYTGSTYAEEGNDFSLFPSSTQTSSCGGNDGQAQMVATGDNPPFTYDWSNGQSGVFATGLTGGSYDVTITDNIGCTKEATVNVLGAFPTANVNPSAPTCNGYFDGTATASITSGFGPYTFAWSSGGNAQVETGLGAGTYTVSITDASGCTGTENVTVTNPPLINVNTTSSTDPTVCRGNDGVATATVTGGVAPYSFLWDNGKTTSSNISLSAGIHTVTVTDASGCQEVETVTLSDPNAPSLSTNGSSVTCGDDSTGTASVNITGGTPPYSVLWSTNETTNNISNLPSGSYSVQVIDGAGCVAFDNAVISGPDPLLALLTPNYDLSDPCNSEIYLTSISGGTPPYSYAWNDPNNQTTPTAVGLCNGTYELTVTDNSGCVKTFTIILYNPRTSVEEKANQVDWLNVFPNPTKGTLNVTLSKDLANGTIKVVSATGADVLSITNAPNKGTYNLDLSSLTAGNYFLMIDGDETHAVQQIQIIE